MKTEKQASDIPRIRMPRSARRQQLLGVANHILAKEGIKGLTMERLSKKANISKPVVYSHFNNRSWLLVALLKEYWQRVDDAIPYDFPGCDTFEEYLHDFIHSYFDVVLSGNMAIRQLIYKVVEDPVVEAARLEREEQVFNRWKLRLCHYCDRPLDVDETRYAAVLLRNIQASGASYALQVGESRARIEEMIVAMGLGLFELLDRP